VREGPRFLRPDLPSGPGCHVPSARNISGVIRYQSLLRSKPLLPSERLVSSDPQGVSMEARDCRDLLAVLSANGPFGDFLPCLGLLRRDNDANDASSGRSSDGLQR